MVSHTTNSPSATRIRQSHASNGSLEGHQSIDRSQGSISGAPGAGDRPLPPVLIEPFWKPGLL
jgi:hypothetical protein